MNSMKTHVGNHVRSASDGSAPTRNGPAALASSQTSCFQISAIFASRLATSTDRRAPCHAADRYMAPWEWEKPSAVQFGDATYKSWQRIMRFMSWRSSGVAGVIASLRPYLSSRYFRITSDSKTVPPSARTSAGHFLSGLTFA